MYSRLTGPSQIDETSHILADIIIISHGRDDNDEFHRRVMCVNLDLHRYICGYGCRMYNYRERRVRRNTRAFRGNWNINNGDKNGMRRRRDRKGV